MTEWTFREHESVPDVLVASLPFEYDGGEEFPEWLQRAHDKAAARLRNRLHPIWIRLLLLAADNDPHHGFLHTDLIATWSERYPIDSQDVYRCMEIFSEYGGLSALDKGWQITDWSSKFRPTHAVIEDQQ